jgi:circadian clock protein KaiB
MDQHAFTLFIAGGTELASRALANFDRLVRERLGDRCHLTVIDILKEPRRARQHRVLATPMLVRERPAPVLRILGDLSHGDNILIQLGLNDVESSSARASVETGVRSS